MDFNITFNNISYNSLPQDLEAFPHLTYCTDSNSLKLWVYVIGWSTFLKITVVKMENKHDDETLVPLKVREFRD